LACELKVSLREIESTLVERAGDLAAIVSGLDEGDTLLFDARRIRKHLIDVLCTAMKQFELNIVVGKGMSAQLMPLAVKPFTCIGMAEKLSDCESDLARSFDIVLPLQRYNEPEMGMLVERLATNANMTIEPAATNIVVRLAEGNPGKAAMLLQRLTLSDKRPITEAETQSILFAFGHQTRSPRAVSGLVDLADLTGVEFERLIVRLLEDLGFHAEMTKATGDGGVDIEAVLDRPIVGGRYLIQCKRFAADTLVGSPTVREFYGALVADRKAVKGILITTSDFSAQAREFSEHLPIELIDGAKLAELLAQLGN
jgi:HJR/Mrr/RecB family endonuclease